MLAFTATIQQHLATSLSLNTRHRTRQHASLTSASHPFLTAGHVLYVCDAHGHTHARVIYAMEPADVRAWRDIHMDDAMVQHVRDVVHGMQQRGEWKQEEKTAQDDVTTQLGVMMIAGAAVAAAGVSDEDTTHESDGTSTTTVTTTETQAATTSTVTSTTDTHNTQRRRSRPTTPTRNTRSPITPSARSILASNPAFASALRTHLSLSPQLWHRLSPLITTYTSYLLHPHTLTPTSDTRIMLVLVGVPGAGKSHFSNALCAQSERRKRVNQVRRAHKEAQHSGTEDMYMGHAMYPHRSSRSCDMLVCVVRMN